MDWPFRRKKEEDAEAYSLQRELKKAGITVVSSMERDERKKTLSETVSKLYDEYYEAVKGGGDMPFEEKRKLLDKLYHIIQATSIAYGRGLDNPEYAEKAIIFIQDYWEFRDWPSDVDRLLAEAWMLVSYSWAEKDMEPIPPIVIHKTGGIPEELFMGEVLPEESLRMLRREKK